MKFLKYMQVTATMVAVALSLSACGGDEEDGLEDVGDGDNTEVPGISGGDSSIEAMDPTQAKDYLETTALEVLSIVDPVDQEPLIRVMAEFDNNYAQYDAPSNWGLSEFEDDDDDYYRAPRHNAIKGFMNSLGRAARGDMASVSRAMSEMLNMARFQGIYEPGKPYSDEYGDIVREWTKVGDSDDIIFRFPANGKTVEVKGVAEGGTWSESVEGVTVEVPRKVTVTLTDGGTQLVNGVLETNLDFNAHTLSSRLNADLMNITVKATVDGNNSRVNSEVISWYGGRQLSATNAVVNGSNMLDLNSIKNLFKEETETWGDYTETYYELDVNAVGRMFKNGTIDANVIDKIRVAGTVSGVDELVVSMDQCFDEDEFESKDDAEAACRKQCELLERLMPVKLYLNGSANPSANVAYQPHFDGSEWWWEWYSEPLLKFDDGTTTSFVSYFGGSRFINLDTPIRNIVNTFLGYWPYLVDDED